ncbi:MAG: molybdopterin-dependent oxidoreductase [Anaerolineales bacterium]|nr:molybdopterin-dependent oxidoreductase [Anaerolineales bacterium]
MQKAIISIECLVNDEPARYSGANDKTLLDFLRDDLRLTGVKKSCDSEGVCGSCTVIVDGVAKRACQILLKDVNGARIETIEGLARKGELHPLQMAFVLDRVMQCGYATPGQIMSCKALLDANPNPTEKEIAEALRYNISRCSAGYRVVKAVMKAAACMRGEIELPWNEEMERQYEFAISKTTGSLKYTDDLTFPGMAYGIVKRSIKPHARIDRIDIEKAKTMPGVLAVFTAGDIPGENIYGLVEQDKPLFAYEVIRQVGEALALVVAETLEQASAASEKIIVLSTDLPVISTPQQALEVGAPELHPPHKEGQHGNIQYHIKLSKGDVETAFEQADVIVEGDYYTPHQEHAYEELESSISVPDGDGVTIYGGSQGTYFDQEQIARILDLPMEKVRVASMPIGGGFGGKEDLHAQPFAALAAFKLKRPVKVKYTRYESMVASHKRHPMYMHYKNGATRDGKLVALKVVNYGDTGAYASSGEPVLFRTSTFAGGPYVIPHTRIDGYSIYTNNSTCGAFRGFGSTQSAFASEVQMDKLARALGIDPLDFRLQNAFTNDSTTVAGSSLSPDVGESIRSCFIAVKEALRKTVLPEPGKDEKVGVGIAGCYKNVGLGSGIPDNSGAKITLQPDGTFMLRIGTVDLGQGATETMVILAGKTLGISEKCIKIHLGDTHLDPYGGMTTASRTTFTSGNATILACNKLLDQIRDYGAKAFHIARDEISLDDEFVCRLDTGERLISLKDLADKKDFSGFSTYDPPATKAPPEWVSPSPQAVARYSLHFAFSFGAQAMILTVNEKSGRINIHKIIAAFDCGKAINRAGVEGQIEGGVIQGLGYAMSERFTLKDGIPQVTCLKDLGLPITPGLPPIVTIIIENPHPLGPMGAKGMGELPLNAVGPCLVNGIYDAVGVWINQLPITPEKVLTTLASKE